MKPIRVERKSPASGKGTWVDTVFGTIYAYAVIVWDDGDVGTIIVDDLAVIDVKSIQLRAI